MQLTRYTDYAIRTLIYLSLREDGERSTIKEIAEYFNVPRNHLVKVGHHLGMLGLIETTRGKSGGVVLGRPADKINIGDVVRQMETRLDIIDCNSPMPCPIAGGCVAKSVFNEARDAFFAVLDQYTLENISHHPQKLKILLHMPQSGRC